MTNMPPMLPAARARRRPPPRPRTWRVALTGLAVATLGLAGCSLPAAEEPAPATDPTEAPIGSSTPDPARDRLVAEIERLAATVTAARDALAGAVDPGSTAAAHTAASEALDVLVAEGGATGPGSDGPRPLFPAETLDRDEADDAPDQLTNTLTRARDVGGTLGTTVIDLLRDPVAGDVGAWERDAAGVLASVDGTIADVTTLEEREAAIAELPGLGTRAVAWARSIAEATSVDDAHAYAERGVANLDVVLVTLERLDLAS